MIRSKVCLASAVLLVTPLLGCSQLPVDGPIVETQSEPDVDEARVLGIDPVPPEENASQVDIVNGFLDAMTAWPQRLDVAKEFLTTGAQASWKPDHETVTYLDRPTVRGAGNTVLVEFGQSELLDHRGAWRGPLDAEERVIQLRLTKEDGEYRIVNPPNRQLVPSDWFAARYRQANVYYLDNSSRILVPEPVFVPRGDTAATTLVARLLEVPSDGRIETTAFPAGMDVDLSTPVSDEGVADIRLINAPPPASPETIEKMLAQLSWTLRQEDISALRLTISGEEIRLPGGVSEFDITTAHEYAPTGYRASLGLHGLRGGLLVSEDREKRGELVPVTGPFGVRPRPLRSVTVSIDGSTAAAISRDGHRVLLAPVSQLSPDSPGAVTAVLSAANNLLRPAWDFSGRLWLVDRTSAGAKVMYVEPGEEQVRTLEVPDVSGQQVADFLISRDGTRFVAVVRTPLPENRGTIDQLRAGRIAVPEAGGTLQALATEQLPLGGAEPLRLEDIAWNSTTTIAALSAAERGQLYSVQTVAVDGAPTDTSPTSIAGNVTGLACTPLAGENQYAVTRTSMIDIPTGTEVQFGGANDGSEVTSLDYVG